MTSLVGQSKYDLLFTSFEIGWSDLFSILVPISGERSVCVCVCVSVGKVVGVQTHRGLFRSVFTTKNSSLSHPATTPSRPTNRPLSINNITLLTRMLQPRGEPRLELGVHRLSNYVELFWNSLDNAPSSIVIYFEMKVEVGVHDIMSRFTPRLQQNQIQKKNLKHILHLSVSL